MEPRNRPHPSRVSELPAQRVWGSVAALQGTGLTRGALAQKLVDFVQAVAVLETGAAGTLVRVDLTVHALVAWGGGR